MRAAKAYREQQGKTLADAERDLGIQTWKLSRYENGAGFRNESEEIALARWLGHDLESIRVHISQGQYDELKQPAVTK